MPKNYIVKISIDSTAADEALVEKLTEAMMSIAEAFVGAGNVVAETTVEDCDDGEEER